MREERRAGPIRAGSPGEEEDSPRRGDVRNTRATWTHPAHLYLRRARADAQLFGTPAAYRERYLEALGAPLGA